MIDRGMGSSQTHPCECWTHPEGLGAPERALLAGISDRLVAATGQVKSLQEYLTPTKLPPPRILQ